MTRPAPRTLAIAAASIAIAQPFIVTPSGTPQAGGYQPRDATYHHDDGTRESALSLSGTGELGWLQSHTALPGAEAITAVHVVWEDVPGYKTLTFRGFEALTVEALRDLKHEKDHDLAARDRRLEALERENAELRARLERLESVLKASSPDQR